MEEREILEIKNFLLIKQAKFEVKRFNVIIGTQASGKSVVSKLLYFFQKVLPKEILKSVEKLDEKALLEKAVLEQFIQIFPQYTWIEQAFSLHYKITDKYEISIIHQENEPNIEMQYSSDFNELFKKLEFDYKNKIEHNQFFMFRDILYPYLQKTYLSSYFFSQSIFISANRSFFSMLQKNIFSFLMNDIDIDYFVKEFGVLYERAKSLRLHHSILKTEPKILETEIKELVEQILMGNYLRENEQDWILTGGKKVNIANASSGQQESLPMLLILSELSLIIKNTTFFIEEPEAHLFPVSQKHIISLLSLIYNQLNHNFVITTHSPYILTAINNGIMAAIVGSESEEKSKQVNEIIDKKYWINPQNVSAYTLEDGILKTIVDGETRLIGENIIDSVSDEFGSQFDALLDIQADE